VIRTLHPELLDTLPAQDASAIGSRRDLRRLNSLMGHAGIMARSLKNIFPDQPPSNIVEIGAGDGQLLLRVARNLHRGIKPEGTQKSEIGKRVLPLPEGRGKGEGGIKNQTATNPPLGSVDVLFVDQKNLLREETKAEFAALNWRVQSIEADIFEWLKNPNTHVDVVVANLVLHHFTDAQLTLLFSELAEITDAFVAVEPRRGQWPLLCASLLGLIGCNAVTRHDAPVSVRAGFSGRELSALWPCDGEWELTERRAGLFSHLFVARRKG
jgi:SAM-dependent methyltransferase